MNEVEKYRGEGRIDFHLHTTNSDGENTPKEVFDRAAGEGLKIIALTDHNKFSLIEPLIVDIPQKIQYNTKPMLVLPGCEFSVTYRVPAWHETAEIHIVGLFPYGVDPEDFTSIFENIDEGKKLYVSAILKRLNERGIHISQEEVDAVQQRTGRIGRHQIAEVLITKGYAKDMDDAFDRHIGNFSPYYLPATQYVRYASLDQVVRQIRLSTGIPILAHPFGYSMNEKEIETLIADFKKSAGKVAGMEVYYEQYLKNGKRMAFLKKMAEQYDLLASAASDRHRDGQSFASTDHGGLFDKMIVRLQENKLTNQ